MLTAKGYKKTTYQEYIIQLETQAKELFGQDINLSVNGPMGKFIRLIAFGQAEKDELAEAIYLAGGIDSAEGTNLDFIAKNSGMTRKQAQKAKSSVTMKVTPGATIVSGTVVSTASRIQFVTTENVTDSGNTGSLTAPIEAVLPGASGNVPAGAIKFIDTPRVGLDSVTNAAETKGGESRESDAELRARHRDLGANGLSSTINGIRAVILDGVPGVTNVTIFENDTPAAVGARPPHSFETVVSGGIDTEIAAAILKAKPAGIRAYGSTVVTIKDDSGHDQTIGFSYAANINLWIKVQVTRDLEFPADGATQIKNNIIKYIGGLSTTGDSFPGLGMGQDVIAMQLAVNALQGVPGVRDATITTSKNGTTFAPGNVVINDNEVAKTDLAKIEVIAT
ncbi:J-like baseplate protein [Bacillus phage vB_BcM_Sam46]|uniref:J-like baseplate protein n=2 Tax=Caudoviricetes TaxID=2731619 RepID=A0A6G9L6N8_9CAUD|nr:J-like baseplate protein [Bacillus phage vB_BcM_Sam112]QIQ61223.1 J-like baseplate protein [Bacillus phage vB_BcM_Sam46]